MSWPHWFPREGDAVERLRLDVKREHSQTRDDVACDMAKDVAAMANAVGGRVFVGAHEENGVLSVVTGFAATTATSTKDALERACRDRLEPAVVLDAAVVELTPTRGPSRDVPTNLVVAEVQPAPGQPTGVRRRGKGDVAFTFPVRDLQ